MKSKISIIKLMVVLCFVVSQSLQGQAGAVDEFDDFLLPRIGFVIDEGQSVTLVPPPPELPLGISGTISTVQRVRVAGSFLTEITSGQNLFTLIKEIIEKGFSVAKEVKLTVKLPDGTIEETHKAFFYLSREPATFPGNFVVIITGEGNIQRGTGRYRNTSGHSTLYFKFEMSLVPDQNPVFRTGVILFDFDLI